MSGSGQGDPDAGKARALALTPVSRETEMRLNAFVALLRRWQTTQNLVAASTLGDLWLRHVADSLQLLPLGGGARTWADFGSGGGFPGITLACALTETEAKMHLVESNGKKAAFLREAVRLLELRAEVHAQRAEEFVESCAEQIDAVTARALSPLKKLCDLTFPLIARGAVGLFPKGQDVDVELTEATKYWTIDATKIPSLTSPGSQILVVRGLSPRKGALNEGP